MQLQLYQRGDVSRLDCQRTLPKGESTKGDWVPNALQMTIIHQRASQRVRLSAIYGILGIGGFPGPQGQGRGWFWGSFGAQTNGCASSDMGCVPFWKGFAPDFSALA